MLRVLPSPDTMRVHMDAKQTKYEPAKPQKTIVFFSLLAFTLCSREASLARSIVIIIRFFSPELGRPEGRPSRLLLGGTHLGIPKKAPEAVPD